MTIQIPVSAWEPAVTAAGKCLAIGLPLGLLAIGIYAMLCGMFSKPFGVFQDRRDLLMVGTIAVFWGLGLSAISLSMTGVIEFI